MINNTVYDFESITCQTPAGAVSTFEEISYDVEKDIDVKTDSQGNPRGYIRKAFKGDCKVTLSLAEYESLVSGEAKGIFGADPMPIVVSYASRDGEVITDKITVKFTKAVRKVKKDDEVMMELTGKQTEIPSFNGNKVYEV